MFNNLVILKRSPWFIYAASEHDAINIASKIGDQVVGVVQSEKSLIVKDFKMQPVLTNVNQKLIESSKDETNMGISEEDIDKELEKELENED